MANLDPRLLDLVETLAASGFDWLAYELIDGARRGRAICEPEAELARVREQLLSDLPSKPWSDTATIAAAPVPRSGDEQIDWATDYIVTRLEGVLEQLSTAIDNLDAVGLGQNDAVFTKAAQAGPLVIALEGEPGVATRPDKLGLAFEGLAMLRQSVIVWRSTIVSSGLS